MVVMGTHHAHGNLSAHWMWYFLFRVSRWVDTMIFQIHPYFTNELDCEIATRNTHSPPPPIHPQLQHFWAWSFFPRSMEGRGGWGGGSRSHFALSSQLVSLLLGQLAYVLSSLIPSVMLHSPALLCSPSLPFITRLQLLFEGRPNLINIVSSTLIGNTGLKRSDILWLKTHLFKWFSCLHLNIAHCSHNNSRSFRWCF